MKKFRISMLLGLVGMLALSVMFVGMPAEASAAVYGDNYPYKYDSSSDVDPWGFYKRNCTSFVAWRMNNEHGISFYNTMGGGRWGNAYNWDDNGRALGYTVDNNPTVGSIAQWEAWSGGAYGYGHVAYVAGVSGNYVTVEEYNWSNPYAYSTRQVHVSNISNFIHVAN